MRLPPQPRYSYGPAVEWTDGMQDGPSLIILII